MPLSPRQRIRCSGSSTKSRINAHARELTTNKDANIQIIRDSGLSTEGIDNFEGLAGEYNVLNATAAAALASADDITPQQIVAALASFKSVKRRLEVKAQMGGVTLIDDFAHHPTAIAGTIAALRGRYVGSRLWVILEPRSNTMRRNVFQQELANSLALADEVVIAQVFKSEAIPENERLNLGAVITEIKARGRKARILSDADKIVAEITPELRSGDVVAILSNGGFDGIYEKLPVRFRELSGTIKV